LLWICRLHIHTHHLYLSSILLRKRQQPAYSSVALLHEQKETHKVPAAHEMHPDGDLQSILNRQEICHSLVAALGIQFKDPILIPALTISSRRHVPGRARQHHLVMICMVVPRSSARHVTAVLSSHVFPEPEPPVRALSLSSRLYPLKVGRETHSESSSSCL
jgi:hypothetical protein